MITLSCIECGKSFDAMRSSAKFCSANCRVKFNKKNPEPSVEVKVQKDEPRTELVVEKTGLKEIPAKKLTLTMDEVNEKINKDFGEGTIMRWGDKPDTDYKVISTGSLQLDLALGIGGLPMGRMVEVYGLESSGKSTIALHVIANAQKQGLRCLLIDAENAFDPEYAQDLGVVLEDLDYCQPSYGEEGLEIADRKISSGGIGVVIIDSVAALVPKAELEGEMGDSKMGLHARLMSQACRKLNPLVAKNNTLLIFINQVRNKIGVMMGNPEVTTGGMALQFYSSIRLHVSRSTTNENSIINDGIKEGNRTTVKVIKNKCAPPFRKATFNILYGKGVDRISEVVDVAADLGVIQKSGSWYSYKGDKLGQGASMVRTLFADNTELYQEIENLVLEKIKKDQQNSK